jgi:hypothetical protein
LTWAWRAVAVWSVVLASAGRAEPPAPRVVLKAEPAPEWSARFSGREGWLGGDCVYSATLGGDRILWLFGDTLVGTAREGRRDGAVMVSNTLGVQDLKKKDAPVRFVTGRGEGRKPAAFFTPPDGKGWFWAQAAVRCGDRLLVFLPQIDRGEGEIDRFVRVRLGPAR